jgi:tetratricopeptide (TPR) repeat protein
MVALNNLAVELLRRRQYVEAESLAIRASRVGRGTSFTMNAVVAQVAQGHFDAAAATIARYAAVAPASPTLMLIRANLAASQGDYAAGLRMLEQVRTANRASAEWQANTGIALARLSRLTGRVAEAERYFRETMAADEARGSPGEYLGTAAELAWMEVDLRGRPDSAVAIVEAALARHPLSDMSPVDRPYSLLTIAYLRAGKPDQARKVWREYEAAVTPTLRQGDLVRRLAEGKMAEADHRPEAAATVYREWYESSGLCGVCGLFQLAQLADQAGRTDSALALYQRAFAVTNYNRYNVDAIDLLPALKRAGELYEAKGDRAKASQAYRRFVDLWKDADPALQPGVREIRARLGRLATENGP